MLYKPLHLSTDYSFVVMVSCRIGVDVSLQLAAQQITQFFLVIVHTNFKLE